MRTSALALLITALWAVPAAAAPLGFDKPVYVDQHLAGGEPVLLADTVHHDIIYSSHEGTTHLYRPGLASSTTSTSPANYRNQVNIWTSRDDGRTWQVDDFGGTASRANPAKNTGFSDPDLTQDAGGRVYNTGINLANDALFSSNDGGAHLGPRHRAVPRRRPAVARRGGKDDEVFLATNVSEGDALPPDLPVHRRRQHLLVDRHPRRRHAARRRRSTRATASSTTTGAATASSSR